MKFHYSNLKDRMDNAIANALKFIVILFNLLMILVISITFLPIRIISFNANCVSNLQDDLHGYFLTKIIFKLYC